jgi:[protein-PII] uridylyltransferase
MEVLASRSVKGKPPHIGGDDDKVPARIRAALEGIQEDKPEELRKAVRELLDKESAYWMEQVRGGGNGLSVAHQRSQFFSILLCELWKRAGGTKAGETLVMGAVGGFGRGEMSPASDLDLVFIRDGSQAEVAEEVVKKVLYVLWDLGCKVGHACRTISESIERSESEPMIKTALLDARYLAGSSLLWEKFQSEYKKRSLEREVKRYLSWRLENQQSRHSKEGGTVFVQEPNLKSGVGGLRDFHNLRWVGKVCGEGESLEKLVQRGWLGEEEARQVNHAFGFLMMVREWLHYGQGGPGDVLTLRRQGELAEAMGYPQPNILRKSEALMREVYGQMRILHLLCNSTATRLCQQRLGKPRGFWGFFGGWKGARRATDGFVLVGAELEAEHPRIFIEEPARFIRMFRIMQDQGSVPGAELKALVRANYGLLTDDWVKQKKL